jgi:Protein of unknown function (DUF4231)
MNEQATNEGAKFVAQTLDDALRRSWQGQKLWSFADHGATVCIVVFSATAAVLTQADGAVHGLHLDTVATVLSLCVTIVSTVQSKLGFERKWVANRMTQSALRQLLLDERTGADLQQVKQQLKTILDVHDKAIVARDPAG